MDNRNRDYHFFASDITFDRVDLTGLDDSKPMGDVDTVTHHNCVPTSDEFHNYKKSLGVILGIPASLL